MPLLAAIGLGVVRTSLTLETAALLARTRIAALGCGCFTGSNAGLLTSGRIALS